MNSKLKLPYLERLLVDNDTSRVIIASVLIESELGELLERHFVDGDNSIFLQGELSTFSNKIALCYSLGLISSMEKRLLSMIRKVRNEFAHTIDTERFGNLTFENTKIVDIIRNILMPESELKSLGENQEEALKLKMGIKIAEARLIFVFFSNYMIKRLREILEVLERTESPKSGVIPHFEDAFTPEEFVFLNEFYSRVQNVKS